MKLENGMADSVSRATWQEQQLRLHDNSFVNKFEECQARSTSFLHNLVADQSGLHVWRIKGFRALHWPTEEYGHFYEEDCFLILTIRSRDVKHLTTSRHIYVWLGRKANPDDISTAFLTAQILDRHFDSETVLHRVAEGQESQTFLNHFNPIFFFSGSSDKSYSACKMYGRTRPTRLMKFCKPSAQQNNYQAKEVPARLTQLNNSFVYILDTNKGLCQWNGALCRSEDVHKACQHMERLKANRGCDLRVAMVNDGADEQEGGQYFYPFLSRASYMYTPGNEEEETSIFPSLSRTRNAPRLRSVLLKLQTNKGQSLFVKVKEGNIATKDFDKKGVNIIDAPKECFIWISKHVAPDMRSSALIQIHDYLCTTNHPLSPATVVMEGQKSAALNKLLA